MTSIADQLYLESPVWLQQAIVALYGWRWYRKRFNSDFHRHVKAYKSRESWTREQFRGYQEERLAHLLEMARKSIYYSELFKKHDVCPHLSPFETLERLPFLTKDILRACPENLLTCSSLPPGIRVFKSSGTTGTPTSIYYTHEFHALELAVPEARNLNWAGVNFQDRRVMLGVRKVCDFGQTTPPFWRYSPAENMAYASIYHLAPQFLHQYIQFLRAFQPAIIMGYPSALAVIAQYAIESGDVLLPARAVVTTSETVSDQVRQALENVWQCRVWDRYGAVEGSLFASQCKFGRYHVSPEVGLIEIVDDRGKPCPPGVMGEVICTGLQNTLQPLVRYRIGDVARWAVEQECPCGRQMPILEAIDGRIEDICVTPDGRQMLRFDTVFKGVSSIKEAQVVQQRIDLFNIRVVPTDDFNGHDGDKLKENMRLHAGEIQVNIEIVDHIERSASGKFRAVICNLSPDEKSRVLGSPLSSRS